MSLILEALRKSEAERRRGQVPDLHAERPPAAQPARAERPGWQWLALAIVAVVATTWLARGLWSPPPRVADTSHRTHAAEARPYAGHAPTGTGNTDAATPIGGSTSAPVAPMDLAVPIPPIHPAAMPTTAVMESPSALPPRAVPTVAPAGNAIAATATVATPVPPAAVAPLSSPAQAPAPATTPSITAALPADTAAAIGNATPLRLSDLTAAERLELPPLKISMHLWAPTPTQRFAIIDGARVNEGDRLGDAVVDEITASAVVLAWRGQRVQIPIH